MLANFEEAQKGYEEQIALLKDSLERLPCPSIIVCWSSHMGN
jgi:hypothetical protein